MNWHKVGSAALVGALAAAAIDWQSFKKWKSFKDAAKFDWGTAIFRWVQGAAIVGGVALLKEVGISIPGLE